MKKIITSALLLLTLLVSVLAAPAMPAHADSLAQATTPPAGETPPPSNPSTFQRPLVIIAGYSPTDEVGPGSDFNLALYLRNDGQRPARNLVITFTAGEFIPRETGGVLALAQLENGESKAVTQPMTASAALAGTKISNIAYSISYTDTEGIPYTATGSIAIKLSSPRYGPVGPTATPTSVVIYRPQLVISSYGSDIDPLQPGSIFSLSLGVRNLGNANAKAVTMVLGGGSFDNGSGGTPAPGGVSGSGGDLTNFAPLGTSNLVYLGDLSTGQEASAEQQLIVNVNTNPGAYPMKISFVYTDEKGQRMVDDQVITLLVYRLPQVEISFYRDPGPAFAGQPISLPVQIVNMGRNAVVLGSMKVEADNGTMENNISSVGPIEPGGYFSLDPMFFPMAEGPTNVTISVSYTDDFNQQQTLTQTIPLEVQPPMDMGPVGPGGEGIDTGTNGGMPLPEPAAPETFWDKVVRFFRGLFGLGSDTPKPAEPGMPVEGMPGESGPIIEQEGKPIPVPAKGG